jgi:hypothetical protein
MLTWSKNGNCVKMDDANDRIRGSQRIKSAWWYATGATAGSTALLLSETQDAAPIIPAIAEAAQLVKSLPVPEGRVEGITLTTLGAGYVMIYFEERSGINPKKLHDETPEAAA